MNTSTTTLWADPFPNEGMSDKFNYYPLLQKFPYLMQTV